MVSRILGPSRMITIPATKAFNVASKICKINIKSHNNTSKKIKIRFLDKGFQKIFLYKDEPSRGVSSLCFSVPLIESVNTSIIRSLGGIQKAKCSLSEVIALIEKQRDGESGVLLTNAYRNVFYVPDSQGVIHAVSIYWSSIGWVPCAYPLNFEIIMGKYDLIFYPEPK